MGQAAQMRRRRICQLACSVKAAVWRQITTSQQGVKPDADFVKRLEGIIDGQLANDALQLPLIRQGMPALLVKQPAHAFPRLLLNYLPARHADHAASMRLMILHGFD